MTTPAHAFDGMAELSAYLSANAEHDPATGCLLWTGATTSGGGVRASRRMGNAYGSQSATYLAWLAAHGTPPPAGTPIRHTCNSKRCINPYHLTTARQKAQHRTEQREAAQVARRVSRKAQRNAALEERRRAREAARLEAIAARNAREAARTAARVEREAARAAAKTSREAARKVEREAGPYNPRRPLVRGEMVELYNVAGTVTAARMRGRLKVGRHHKLNARTVYNIHWMAEACGTPGHYWHGKEPHLYSGLPRHVFESALQAPRPTRLTLPNGDAVWEMADASVPLLPRRRGTNYTNADEAPEGPLWDSLEDALRAA